MTDDSILRTVESNLSTVRFDLNDGSDFLLAQGLDLGTPGLVKVDLGASGVDGRDRVSDSRTNAIVTIPLVIPPKESIDEIDALYDQLVDELEQSSNVLERRRLGSEVSFFMDIVGRSDFLPTMERGQTLRPDCVLFDATILVQLERLPWMRLSDGTLVHR